MSANAEQILNMPPEKAGTLNELIDEFAEVHLRIAQDLARHDALKKKLTGFAAEFDTNEPVTLSSDHYVLEYSAPSQSDKCTLDAQQFIEQTGSWESLSISVAEARKQLPASAFMALFQAVRGSRRLLRVSPRSR